MLSIFAIYQKFTGTFIPNPFWAAEATRRVTSFYPYPNALALYLAPIVTMLIGWVVLEFKKVKTNFWYIAFFAVTAALSLRALQFTVSKGALLAVLIGIIFYAIFFIS